MTDCKCGHPDYSHRWEEFECFCSLIKYQSEFYEIDFAPGLKAWTQKVEYEGPCQCKAFIAKTKSMVTTERKRLPDGNLSLSIYMR